jgi:monoterpene epsilon-lactone hydrolase
MTSLQSYILNPLICVVSKRRLARTELTAESIAVMRERLEHLASRLPLPHGLTREWTDLGGVPTEWTRRPAPRRGVIFYCHGGAYALGSPAVYRGMAARLALLTHCDVAVIDYRLMPEHPYPAAPEDAIAAYDALIGGTPGERIVVAGDSAGGNLALVTLLRAHARGLPQPAAAVLLSPWTDLTGSGASMQQNARRDSMLPAHRVQDAAWLYAPGRDLVDPDISPLFGDLGGLPPLALHVGSIEILLDDSRRLADRVRHCGGEADLTIWRRMPHVFPMFAGLLPEARRALEAIAAFILSRLPPPAPQTGDR